MNARHSEPPGMDKKRNASHCCWLACKRGRRHANSSPLMHALHWRLQPRVQARQPTQPHHPHRCCVCVCVQAPAIHSLAPPLASTVQAACMDGWRCLQVAPGRGRRDWGHGSNQEVLSCPVAHGAQRGLASWHGIISASKAQRALRQVRRKCTAPAAAAPREGAAQPKAERMRSLP